MQESKRISVHEKREMDGWMINELNTEQRKTPLCDISYEEKFVLPLMFTMRVKIAALLPSFID